MSVATTAVVFVVPGAHLLSGLFGERDAHLRMIEHSFPDTKVNARGNEVSINGPDAALVARLLEELTNLIQRGETLSDDVVLRSIEMVRQDERPSVVLTEEILKTGVGRTV